MLDNLVLTNPSGAPTLKINLPHMFLNPTGNARKLTDPRYVLTHGVQDFQWDDYDINLSSHVDFQIPSPPPPQPIQQIVQPPTLAITHY